VWICYVPALLEPTGLGAWVRKLWDRRAGMLATGAIIVGCFGVLVAVHNRFWQLQVPTDASQSDLIYPAGALAHLERHEFRGNVMVPFEVGSFVSWKMYPKVKVSLDGRFEVAYPVDALAENIDFYRARPGWKEVLSKYATDAVLVRRSDRLDEVLDAAVATGDGPLARQWQRVYRDDGFSLFLRSDWAERIPAVDLTGREIIASYP
jgi:hypothetical protein